MILASLNAGALVQHRRKRERERGHGTNTMRQGVDYRVMPRQGLVAQVCVFTTNFTLPMLAFDQVDAPCGKVRRVKNVGVTCIASAAGRTGAPSAAPWLKM